MEDHRHEDYVRPKVVVKAFSGAGHKLGRYVSILLGPCLADLAILGHVEHLPLVLATLTQSHPVKSSLESVVEM